MDIPVLMPYQMSPMNGDHLITDEMLRLKDLLGLKVAIETGTCFGSTTLWMARNFPFAITIESNQQYQDVAKERAKNDSIGNIVFFLGQSETVLPHVLQSRSIGDDALFLLDAHWGDQCPLLDELYAIAVHKIKPAIVIHDMKNPNDDRFGFDKYNGQEFTFEWVKKYLDVIYGPDGYTHYFNTGFKKESAQRGVLFIHPKL
jgi:hypothetical protein